MAGELELTVAVGAETDGARLSARDGDLLGVADGDSLLIRDEGGHQAAAACRIDESVADGTVVVGERTAQRLAVTDDTVVIVERLDAPSAASVTAAPVVQLDIRGGAGLFREAVGRRPIARGDEVTVSLFDGSLDIPFQVLHTRPAGPVLVDDETDIELESGPAPVTTDRQMEPLPPSAVGGYDDVVERLRSSIAHSLRPAGASSAGRRRRVGLLLAGPHGVGKTHLLRHVAWLTDATLHRVDSGRLRSGTREENAEYLESVATRARGSGRGIVHVDGFDALVDDGDDTLRLALRRWLDSLAAADGVAVVAEVTDGDAVPVDLVQGTRLAQTVSVREPNRQDRAAILDVLASGTETTPDFSLEAVGRRAFGYVAADLVSLWSSAVEAAAERRSGDQADIRLRQADLDRALAATEPSGVRGSAPDVPDVSFDDIGGLDGPKRELTRAVEWPLSHPELFDSANIDPPAGVLLYGPPGTGKTMLARAVAATTDANFIPVNGPELLNKYVGESERGVRRIFDQARSNAPTVVFFDEVDALGAGRTEDGEGSATERVVSQLLTEMDGLEGRGSVTVIGATNRPDRLDDALLRPGRFDRVVSVPVPDRATRAEIFRIHTRDRTTEPLDFDALAERTDGYTGSDIAAVVREAGLLAIEDRIESDTAGRRRVDTDRPVQITGEHFGRALAAVEPSLSPERRRQYESFDGAD